NPGPDPLEDLRGNRRDHRGIGVSGRYDIDGDAARCALERQRLGEADHAGLGGGVVGLAELSGQGVDRADIDDASEAPLAHGFDHRAAHVEATAEIDVDYRVPLLAGHLVQGRIARDACIVHQDVDRADGSDDLGDTPLASVEIRSEEHTSELQSPYDLVCRLLLEKKNIIS